MEKAHTLFDVAGASRLNNDDVLLLVGLESRADRDLDDFGQIDGRFHLHGFEQHALPALEELMAFIRSLGYKAGLFGPVGYPLEGEIRLKEEAVRTGLGKRGKSSVILHPEYGPRLRFMAIVTDAPLQTPPAGNLEEEPNPVCAGCSICIDICPVNILEPYRMVNMRECRSYINPVDEKGKSILCDLCVRMCPAGKPEV